MRLDYTFSNLYGTVHRNGNVVFSPDGNSVFCPTSNRVNVFNLIGNKSSSLMLQARMNVKRVELTPDGRGLLCIENGGKAAFCSANAGVVLATFNFHQQVFCVKFSPDGRFFAVGHYQVVDIYKTPDFKKTIDPFQRVLRFRVHHDNVKSLCWSHDSKYLLSCSKDHTVKLLSIIMAFSGGRFLPHVFSGFTAHPISAFFGPDGVTVYVVTANGIVTTWRYHPFVEGSDPHDVKMETCRFMPDKGHWIRTSSQSPFPPKTRATCCSYNSQAHLLVIGRHDGVFSIFEMPSLNLCHTLSVSKFPISSIALNVSGDWLAVGIKAADQILVWEWQSETYVLKQQGHSLQINCAGYSQNGQLIASGSDDGKLKLWNTSSGFCFVTFTEHTGPISSLCFVPNGFAVVTASYDGSVRAFDLMRYRNYRILLPPAPNQLASVAVDSSGEIVAAGSLDTFEIYVWSLQTSKLLDVLTRHTGPVSGLAFSPTSPLLASCSWDKTAVLWTILEGRPHREGLLHKAECTTCVFSPNGEELAVATEDGQISFWDTADGDQLRSIEGKNDFGQTSKAVTHAFTTLCYTADGQCLLAGGKSRYVMLYHAEQCTLLKRFSYTDNHTLEGVYNFWEKQEEELDVTDSDDSDIDPENSSRSLPGATRGDLSSRQKKLVTRCFSVCSAPTGHSWAAATTEGIVVFSLNQDNVFDPTDLGLDVTPDSVTTLLGQKEYLKALIMSLRLNIREHILQVFESTPPSCIEMLAREFPVSFLIRIFEFIGTEAEQSPKVEFYLWWCTALLSAHTEYIHKNSAAFSSVLRILHKGVSKQYTNLSDLCSSNKYNMQYVSARCHSLPSPDQPLPEAPKPTRTTTEAESTTTTKAKRGGRGGARGRGRGGRGRGIRGRA
ncbi:WD repeat protein [Pelomyxa schiedti]|nr:WD repeat protein [Pelomyxa schiedti]